MAAVGKGDWVQCVCPGRTGRHGVRHGGVYYVERLRPPVANAEPCPDCGNDGYGLEFVGVLEDDDASWCPCGFRPLGGNAKTLTDPAARVTEDA